MPALADHVLVLLFALLLPLLNTLFFWPRLKRALAANLPGVRVRLYQRGIIAQWFFATAAVLLWLAYGRPLAVLGFSAPAGVGFSLGAALAVAAAVALFLQWQRVRRDPGARQAVRRRIQYVAELIPRTQEEIRWFTGLSITAGLCEETLYRGFLLWYLTAFAGLWPAVILSSLLFGLAHAYQCGGGMVRTGLAGLIAALLYVYTGSLWVPMLLHALVDIFSGLTAASALQEPETQPATG